MTDITDKLTQFLGGGGAMFVCKKGHSWADHKEECQGLKLVVVHSNTVSNDEGEHCTVCGDMLKGPDG